MGRHIVVLITVLMALLLTGCKGSSSVRLTDLAPLTADTLTLVLVGIPPERRATQPTSELGLLKADVYESVVIAADAEAFAKVSRGALTVRDIEALQKDVAGRVSDNLKSYGFQARGAKYPPTVSERRTLLAILTPATEETGSPADRAAGKGKTLLLIHLTVTDPLTGTILAERKYYSGTDAKNQPLREFR